MSDIADQGCTVPRDQRRGAVRRMASPRRSTLDEKERELVTLILRDGFGVAEAGASVGRKPATARTRYAPANAKLRDVIRQSEGLAASLSACVCDSYLYLLPRTNSTIRAIAQSNPGLGVVGLGDRTIVLNGRVISLDDDEQTHAKPMRRRPWGRFATARELIRSGGHHRSQFEIADAIGISQAAVSHALRTLREANLLPSGSDPDHGKHRLHALIDYAITEYPGPGGITSYWFTFDEPADAARKLGAAISDARALISGDLAADHYAPWKRTTRLAIYSPRGIDLAAFALAEASRDEANVVLRVPGDSTIFSTAQNWPANETGQFTDPIISAWELTQSPDSDADQAVSHLRRFLERGEPSF